MLTFDSFTNFNQHWRWRYAAQMNVDTQDPNHPLFPGPWKIDTSCKMAIKWLYHGYKMAIISMCFHIFHNVYGSVNCMTSRIRMPNSDVSGLTGLGHTSCPRRGVWDGPVPWGPARGPSTCEVWNGWGDKAGKAVVFDGFWMMGLLTLTVLLLKFIRWLVEVAWSFLG